MESLASFMRTIRITATICVLAWGIWTLQGMVRNHKGLYDTPNPPYVSVTAVLSQSPNVHALFTEVVDHVLAFWRFGN
jgi:hypothetical protein